LCPMKFDASGVVADVELRWIAEWGGRTNAVVEV
jgi:hypothetical protein